MIPDQFSLIAYFLFFLYQKELRQEWFIGWLIKGKLHFRASIVSCWHLITDVLSPILNHYSIYTRLSSKFDNVFRKYYILNTVYTLKNVTPSVPPKASHFAILGLIKLHVSFFGPLCPPILQSHQLFISIQSHQLVHHLILYYTHFVP